MNSPTHAPTHAPTRLPLLPARAGDVPLAWRAGEPYSQRDFLRAVRHQAQRINASESSKRAPAQTPGPVLNLCTDRINFAIALCAAIVCQRVSLLPNSTAPETIAALHREHPDLLCLSDQAHSPMAHLPELRFLQIDSATPSNLNAAALEADMPLIAAEQTVLQVYTSGSTGTPVAHSKTFARLQHNARLGAQRLFAHFAGLGHLLGTVPFQHMYGLESTVLLPLFGGGTLTAERPFFPADVASALARLPAPRILVSTPFHLAKLLEAELPFPPLSGVISATAPLSTELAARVEAQLGAPLIEIYGATETGQLATRRSAHSPEWHTLDGVRLTYLSPYNSSPHSSNHDSQHHNTVIAQGGHLEREQVLNDVIELRDDTHFCLLGRSADMVNIAGKRSSLSYLNTIAARIPGVHDVAFYLPDGADTSGRLAAFFVAPTLDPAQILAALRPHLDPVFLPRPLVQVDALPRNATGKLPASALGALMQNHLSSATAASSTAVA
jgi:acyl-coenzyme A synthetase/AMP-(fatty) acid ligase